MPVINGLLVNQTQDIHQTVILTKLEKYLQWRNEKKPYDKDIKAELDKNLLLSLKEGLCSGFASIWGYARLLQDQPIRFDTLNQPLPRDDLDWFYHTLNMISAWDERRDLSPYEIQEIERFFTLLNYFQTVSNYLPIGQGELQDSLVDTKDRKLQKTYDIALSTDQPNYTEVLKQVVKDKDIILIRSNNHEVCLYKLNDIFIFYDSNNKQGEWVTKDLNELSQRIFLAFRDKMNEPAPIGMRMFNFVRLHDYPAQSDVLNAVYGKLKNPEVWINQQKKEYKDVTALMIACNINSLESAKYHIQQGAVVNIQSNIEGQISTPLSQACSVRNDQLVKLLLDHGADPNFGATSSESPLHTAVKRDSLPIVELLLEKNAKIYSDSLLSPLYLAVQNGNLEITKLLLSRTSPESTSCIASLEEAVKLGNTKIVKLFLDHGIDPNLSLKSLLVTAVEKENDKIVEILLKNKLKPKLTGFNSATSVLNKAIKNGSEKIVNILLTELSYTQENLIQALTTALENNRKLSVIQLLVLQLKRLGFDDENISEIDPKISQQLAQITSISEKLETIKFQDTKTFRDDAIQKLINMKNQANITNLDNLSESMEQFQTLEHIANRVKQIATDSSLNLSEMIKAALINQADHLYSDFVNNKAYNHQENMNHLLTHLHNIQEIASVQQSIPADSIPATGSSRPLPNPKVKLSDSSFSMFGKNLKKEIEVLSHEIKQGKTFHT